MAVIGAGHIQETTSDEDIFHYVDAYAETRVEVFISIGSVKLYTRGFKTTPSKPSAVADMIQVAVGGSTDALTASFNIYLEQGVTAIGLELVSGEATLVTYQGK